MWMPGERYQPSTTRGGFCGCLTAALVGIPLFVLVLLMSSLGDCLPDVPCNHSISIPHLGGVAFIAAVAGFSVRAVVNRFWSRNIGDS